MHAPEELRVCELNENRLFRGKLLHPPVLYIYQIQATTGAWADSSSV